MFGLTLLCLAYCAALLHEHGWLRPMIAGIAAHWRPMPRTQVVILFMLLCWAVSYGGGKNGNSYMRQRRAPLQGDTSVNPTRTLPDQPTLDLLSDDSLLQS